MAVRRVEKRGFARLCGDKKWLPYAVGGCVVVLVPIGLICASGGGDDALPSPPMVAVQQESPPNPDEREAPPVVEDDAEDATPADAEEPQTEPDATEPTEPEEVITPDSVSADSPEPEDETPPAEAEEPVDDTPPVSDETDSDTPPQDDGAPEDEEPLPPEDDTPEPSDTPPSPTEGEDSSATDEKYGASKSLMGLNRDMQKEWLAMLRQAIREKELDAFVSATEKRVSSAVQDLFPSKRFNYSNFRTSPTLLMGMEFCYLVRGAGVDTLAKIFYAPSVGEADGLAEGENFILWALTDRTGPLHLLIRTFKENGGDPAQLGHTIELFFELWKDTKAIDRAKYLNLMLACALVHEGIAKNPGMVRSSKKHALSMAEVYKRFRNEDTRSSSHLLTDVKKLSINNLLYVVDVRLPESEFEWACSEISKERAEWGSLFNSIEYMMERATQDVDPYKVYTFEEIQDVGGVCRDQAYFTVYTAKCRGIPAAIVTGDGPRGPHAWAGLMTSDKGWIFAGSTGYRNGKILNPCSGKMVHQSQVPHTEKKQDAGVREIAANVMLLADYMLMLNKRDEARSAAQFACYRTPTLTACWQNQLDVLKALHEKSPLDKRVWSRLYADMEKYAVKNTELLDLMQEVEADYLLANSSGGAKKNALRRSSRKLTRMVGRDDLLQSSIQRQAEPYASSKDWRGLASFYRQNLKEHVGNGDFFEKLLRQYAEFLEEASAGQEEPDNKKKQTLIKSYWRTLAKDAESLYAKRAYAGDFFRVKKDADIMKLIAEAYRRAGDEKKAAKIEEDADSVLEESRDNAERNSENNNNKKKKKKKYDD